MAEETSLRAGAEAEEGEGAMEEGAVEAESREEREAAVAVLAREVVRACDMAAGS